MTCLHLASFKDLGIHLISACTCLYVSVLAHCSRVREFMAFTSDVLVSKTQAGQRQTVKEQGNQFNVNAKFGRRS